MVSLNGSAPSAGNALPVLKVNARGLVDCVLQSSDFVVINTHWLGRRLWCVGENCPGCSFASIRSLAYAIVTVDRAGKKCPTLLECTLGELSRVQGLADMEGYEVAPGLRLQASRSKPRSPLRIEPTGVGGVIVPALASPRKTVAAAAVLASLPSPGEGTTLTDYFASVLPAVRTKLERAIAANG